MILDEHLRANGIEYLLEAPIDITDYKQFQAELTKEGKHNPLDKAKAIIKANEEENPELALELSELLKKKLIDAKIDRTKLELMKEIRSVDAKIDNVKLELTKEIDSVKIEIQTIKSDTIKFVAGMMIGQVFVIGGMIVGIFKFFMGS